MTRSTINSRSIEGIHSIDATGTVTAAGLTVDTDTLHIDSTNNRVGIGRTSLNYKFEVSSASDVAVGLYNSSSVTSGNRATLASLNSDASSVGYIRFGAVTDNVGTDIQFGVRPAGGSLTEAMRIDSSGRLIVGATYASAPGSITLQSDGDIRGVLASGAGGDTLISAISGVSNGYQISVDTSNNQTYKWHNGGTQSMTLDSSGNVGIGTSSPKTRLQSSAGGVLNAPSLGSSSTNAPLYLTNNDTSYGLVVGNSSADGHVWLQAQRTDGTATAYNITLNEAGGNVGIGTSSPSSKLQIQNDSSTAFNPSTAAFNTVATLKNNTGGASTNALLSFATESNGEWYIGGVQNSGNNAADFVFASRDSGARSERMRINSSGRVTMPYQPAFYAWGSGSQSWSGTSAYQTLQFSNQVSLGSRNTGFNTTTYTFTAPVAGSYAFFARMTQTGTGTGPAMNLFKNGVGQNNEMSIGYGLAYMTTTGFQFLQLAANDTVNVQVINYNNTSFTLDLGRCAFMGWLLG